MGVRAVPIFHLFIPPCFPVARVLTFDLDTKQCWVSLPKRVPGKAAGDKCLLWCPRFTDARSLPTLSLLPAPSLGFLLLRPLGSVLFSCSWGYKPPFVFSPFYFAAAVTCVFFILHCVCTRGHVWVCVFF